MIGLTSKDPTDQKAKLISSGTFRPEARPNHGSGHGTCQGCGAGPIGTTPPPTISNKKNGRALSNTGLARQRGQAEPVKIRDTWSVFSQLEGTTCAGALPLFSQWTDDSSFTPEHSHFSPQSQIQQLQSTPEESPSVHSHVQQRRWVSISHPLTSYRQNSISARMVDKCIRLDSIPSIPRQRQRICSRTVLRATG
ncbi:hypothetical protein ARMGADRAFT_285826 [Armillaria gallica]|uniref:Uncharacterized protein n=1 Tax=Armillaria gallica TaxID=47427 RepID=A0A2H3D740_ARMGA|nr:hypothetical protein ARMGADRAFT_285826 [Armillaria gallica]